MTLSPVVQTHSDSWEPWPGMLDIARSLLNTAACRGEYLEVELLERDTMCDGTRTTYFVVLRPLDLLNR